MARRKKKSSKKKQRNSASFRSYLYAVLIILAIAGGLYFALYKWHVVPWPKGPAGIDLSALVAETREALDAEPSIGAFEVSEKNFSEGSLGRSHLVVELDTDTEIILAEKIIQGLWTDRGLKVSITYPEHTGPEGSDPEGSVLISGRGDAPLISASLMRKPAPVPPVLPEPFAAKPSRIAIIIDDIGYNYEAARKLIVMPYDVTLSILPFQMYSEDIQALAAGEGKEIMLHMPMQPAEYPATDPGEGALLLGMGAGDIERNIIAALDSLPLVSGVNNHMGSAFTASSDGMRAVMKVLRSRGLFFVDSRTTKDTCAFMTAQELGVPSAERKVFLDNVRDEHAIKRSIIELCNTADEDGEAIGIGHPYPETIRVLEQTLPRLEAAGYLVVPASEIVK